MQPHHPTDSPAAERRASSVLPRPVQEHLARQLRATYYERQDKPAFVGDPALPPAFDEPLYRLRVHEHARESRRAGECGLAAVRAALQESR